MKSDRFWFLKGVFIGLIAKDSSGSKGFGAAGN